MKSKPACIVASLEHALKRNEASKVTFQRAVKTANQLPNAHVQANALADIAARLSKIGDTQRAYQLLEQAEKAAAKIPQRDLQQQTLYRVRNLMSKLGT